MIPTDAKHLSKFPIDGEFLQHTPWSFPKQRTPVVKGILEVILSICPYPHVM